MVTFDAQDMLQPGDLDRQRGRRLRRQRKTRAAQRVPERPVGLAQRIHQRPLAEARADGANRRRLPPPYVLQAPLHHGPARQKGLELIQRHRKAQRLHVGQAAGKLPPFGLALQPVENAHGLVRAHQHPAAAIVEFGKEPQMVDGGDRLPPHLLQRRRIQAAHRGNLLQVLVLGGLVRELRQHFLRRPRHGQPGNPAVHPVQVADLFAHGIGHRALDQALRQDVHQKRHRHEDHRHRHRRAEQAVLHARQRDLENAPGGQHRLVLDVDLLHRQPGMMEKGLGMVPPVARK
jgi:hypothetical protein